MSQRIRFIQLTLKHRSGNTIQPLNGNWLSNLSSILFVLCSQKHSLKDQAGFDPRLCYGDIVLSFVYQPDEEIKESQEIVPSEETSPERSESSERHRSQVDVVIYELKRPHDWTLRRFGQLQNCDICQSKVSSTSLSDNIVITNKRFHISWHSQIWLGEGLYCPRCGLIIHKKCFKRIATENRKWCSVNQSIAKIDDYYISNVPIPVEGVKVDVVTVKSYSSREQVTQYRPITIKLIVTVGFRRQSISSGRRKRRNERAGVGSWKVASPRS